MHSKIVDFPKFGHISGADPGFFEGGVWTQRWISEAGGSYRVLRFWTMKIAFIFDVYI